MHGARGDGLGTTLTGYGGVGEIGGNVFLLESGIGQDRSPGAAGRNGLLLDFGKRFGGGGRVASHGARPGWNDYFDDFLKPRTFRYVRDLATLGLLPDMPALYRPDLGGAAGPAPVCGAIVSHAHMDHAGMIGLLKPEIPVLASAQSRAILASMQVTGMGAPEADYVTTKAKGRVGRLKDGALSVKARMADGPTRAWEASASADVGPWTVRQLPVDHSIPGAQAALVEGKDGTLCYTGDFRLHGRNAHLSEKLVERAGGVDVLVAEGTNIHPDHGGHGHGHKQTDHETTVEGTLDDLLHKEAGRAAEGGTRRTGFFGVSYPPRDLDRFVSIHAAAKRHGRRFAISVKQAHLLDQLRRDGGRDDLPDPRNDMSLAVYFEAAGKGLLLESPESVPVAQADLSVQPVDCSAGDVYAGLREGDYREWQQPYLGAPTFVGPLDLRREPGAFVFSISYWSITELFDIFPDRAAANGMFVHSQTQPFNDEMMQDRRKLERWLAAYNLDFAQTHVSGHLGQESLDWVLDEIRPRLLVPIHSEAPDVTADRYTSRTGQRAALPTYGQPITLA